MARRATAGASSPAAWMRVMSVIFTPGAYSRVSTEGELQQGEGGGGRDESVGPWAQRQGAGTARKGRARGHKEGEHEAPPPSPPPTNQCCQ